MSYHVKLTDTALKDINDIADYIAFSLKQRDAAKRQVQRIRERISALAEYPERYPHVKDNYLSNKGYRVISLDRYLIFYKVVTDEKLVIITRILYEKRDWKYLL